MICSRGSYPELLGLGQSNSEHDIVEKDLGTLGGTCSNGVAINDLGQVTAISSTTAGDTYAFLWQTSTPSTRGRYVTRTSLGPVVLESKGRVGGLRANSDPVRRDRRDEVSRNA